MKFQQHRLPNGLEIVAEVNDQAYSTAIGFFVATGARDESEELSGVSHFLEHMAFNGTPRRSAREVNQRLDELGASANAYTSEEKTVYYASVLPEFQSEIFELLADIMRPTLREEDFNTEKKVILEEIYRYEDQPPFGAHEKCMTAYFGTHPLAKTILGTVESVTALTPGKMRTYFEGRYRPGNIVLAAAGRVDLEQLLRDAEQLCGHWPAAQTPRHLPPPHGTTGQHVVCRPEATQQYLVQCAAGPATEDDDRYAARLLATCLGDDSGSRFFWELTDRGLAEFAGLGTYEFQRAGIFMSTLCCEPQDATENLQVVNAIYQDVQRNGIRASELELAKSKVASQIVLRAERPLNRLFAVGSSWVQRRKYQNLREAVRAYDTVTLDQIHEILEKYPLDQHMTLAVGPLESLD